MRKTKIICTLGPATDRGNVLEQLIKEGMNVARFNFSHGDHAEHKSRMDMLKQLREEERLRRQLVQEEIKEEDTLQERVFNMMEHVTNAGRPLTSNFKTLDSFTESVKNYIQNGGDINAVLKDATDKEIAAQSGTSAEGEQADSKTE